MAEENSLKVKISGDNAELQKTLASSVKELEKFSAQTAQTLQKVEKNTGGTMLFLQKTTVVTHGAMKILGIFNNTVSAFVAQNDNIDKMSKRLGIAAGELEALKYAAEQSGMGIDTVTDAMKTFSNVLGAASLGDEGAKGKLANIGIDAADFEGLDASEQFSRLADHIASIEDPAMRARLPLCFYTVIRTRRWKTFSSTAAQQRFSLKGIFSGTLFNNSSRG